MKIRVAGVIEESIVDGLGCRLALFVQGCPRRCAGCHNEQAQSFTGGKDMDTVEIFAKLKSNPLQSGITFSGGEPFAQPAPLIGLAKLAHSAGYDVWSYTGYTYEELRDHEDKNVRELLNEVDVLVDGEYIEGERDLSLAFRGSRNQRVIDMNATRRTGRIVILPI